MSGPCAKVTVTCRIFDDHGQGYIATNACNNPQPVCPREPGEGYEKCETICEQQGHAEIQAIRAAGDACNGGIAIVEGHTYVCQECQEALYQAGVDFIGVRK